MAWHVDIILLELLILLEWCNLPQHFSHQIRGFVITQLNGAGCSNIGNFPILPISGNLNVSPNDMNSYENMKTEIKKFTAGHLSLKMNENINVDLTVSKRSGVAKFNFSESNLGTLIGKWNKLFRIRQKKSKMHILKINPLQNLLRDIQEEEIFCGTETNYKIYLQLNLVMMHI